MCPGDPASPRRCVAHHGLIALRSPAVGQTRRSRVRRQRPRWKQWREVERESSRSPLPISSNRSATDTTPWRRVSGTVSFHEPKVRELCGGAGVASVRKVPLENPFNTLSDAKPYVWLHDRAL